MNANKNQHSSPQKTEDLPTHVIEQFVQTQKHQVAFQTQELKLREKELEINARLAEKQLTYQAEILQNRPYQSRRTFQAAAFFILCFVTLFFLFFGYCVQIGHGDFALKIFAYIMYGVTTIAGYIAGKKTAEIRQEKTAEKFDSAKVVE